MENINMLSGLIGAILGATISFIAQVLILKFNYKHLFAETVTQNRTKTISEMREALSQILGFINNIRYEKKGINSFEELDNKIKENVKNYNQDRTIFYKNIYKTKMLLSIHPEKFGNLYHKELEEELNIILKDNIECIDCKCVENIERYARNIFDYEWQRVKDEAKGEER